MKKRKGLVFGSFDPIHIGHVLIGTQALKCKLVDKVLYIPCQHNPHKKHNPVSYELRADMVEAALRHHPLMDCSRVEWEMPSKTPTWKVLDKLKKQYLEDELIILTTIETFNQIPTWEKGDEVLNTNIFIIAARNMDEALSYDSPRIRGYYYIPNINVSSTLVRNTLYSDGSVIPFVDGKVLDIIEQNSLYYEEFSN